MFAERLVRASSPNNHYSAVRTTRENHQMLTRLEVDCFKTFENLVIDLAPFTVIVGSNAAGKSNLFDVFELLANLADPRCG
ncbi:MAG: AAA family ATPase [Chloroflexi bacterium]|nr:AAA family ATPase [Chloroflexota bacterium]